jgi:hypothetical protein
MNDVETKRAIEDALKAFAAKPIAEAAIALFESLGYKSEKRLALKPNSAANLKATFAKNRPFNEKHALLDDWQSADFLFQLTDDEVRAAAAGDQRLLFEAKGKWNGTMGRWAVPTLQATSRQSFAILSRVIANPAAVAA